MTEEPKRGRGRPPGPELYTDELAQEIAERLSKGEHMVSICSDDHMPTDRTVRNWINSNEKFASVIACARETGHDAIAVKMRQTARGDGESTGDVQRDKLIIETDLKLLAKWNPRRYGDKLAIGGDGDAPPIKSDLTIRFV